MAELSQERHKPPQNLERDRELIIACPPMRSNVNLARIVRTASCCGVRRLVACGNPKIDPKIARDGIETVEIEVRRSLLPVLRQLRKENFQIVGLEQTSESVNMHSFRFERRTVLVVGHERLGISDEVLQGLDHVVEIPVFGLPYSYNAGTAAAMAMYEYCRQFPTG